MTEISEQQPPIPNDTTDIQSLVIADITTRRQVGIQRYGTPLQPHNGRDALRDAYEEALDLAMYLRQAIEERDTRPAGDITVHVHSHNTADAAQVASIIKTAIRRFPFT